VAESFLNGGGNPSKERDTAFMLHPRVMVAEDDAELRELLVKGLRRHELEVTGVGTGAQLLAGTEEWRPDALVIDIGLPDADGRDVCQALRARGANMPVLFLTARDTRADRLSGFSSGGDDYVTKPFDFAEVVARLRALLRRAGADGPSVAVGGLRLDPVEYAVGLADDRVALTPTEFRLLAALAARPGDAVRRTTLIGAAWPDGAIVHDNTLDVYIARLRRKLGRLDGAPQIVTVHGVGYSLR
jgi:two-component system, OmpR family, response regulator